MPDTHQIATRRATGAALAPASLDRDARTVEVIAISGPAPVRRSYGRPDGGRGDWIETLDAASADLSRFVHGPVLVDHVPATDATIGVVEAARVDRGRLLASVRFAQTARADDVIAQIEAGAIRAVSIGYAGGSYTATGDDQDGTPVFNRTGFLILELSFVPIPADPGATVRAYSGDQTMTNAPATAPAAPSTTTNTPATNDNRALAADMIAVTRRIGLPPEFAEHHIAAGSTREAFHAAAIDAVADRAEVPGEGPQFPSRGISVGVDHSGPDATMRAMSEALAVRAAGGTPSGHARQFMTTPLIDMIRSYLVSRGEIGRTASRDEILTRSMHSTSDFPNLLTATGNRILLDAYRMAQSPLVQLSRERTADDFRTLSRLRLGEHPALLEVIEGAEVTSGTRAETVETYRVKTFARIFSLTRQAIINDDLSAFGDWTTAAGQAAAETIAQQLLALLTANSGAGVTMSDGQPLFHTSHNNTLTASAIDNTNLGLARQKLREQLSVDGTTRIGAVPRYVLVAPARETALDTVLAAISADSAANANIFSGRVTPLVEPRMTGITPSPWYVFADPALTPCLEHAFLSDAPGPQFATRPGFEVLGMEMRVSLDFGCGAVDHRGAVRNAGV
jgi:hypothetical protein